MMGPTGGDYPMRMMAIGTAVASFAVKVTHAMPWSHTNNKTDEFDVMSCAILF
jgi:hypothetical protein